MDRTIFEPEHKEFRAAVATYLERSITPQLERYIDDRLIDRAAWEEAGKQGFLGLEVPEEYGGSLAQDYRFNTIATEEMSKVSVGFNSSLQIHADIVAPYLVELGTEELKTRLLPDFCAGLKTAGIGMTEAGGGTDLAALKTTAVPDGDGWLINGSKTFITNGYTADILVVAARTSQEKGARGISLFVIEEGMPGFERGRKLDKAGQHEADTAELFFNDVHVPAENLLGEVGSGFIYMMERLPQERIGCAISNLAHAKQAFLETLEYAKERQAFGKPIGSFQHLKFVLAEQATKLDVTQAYMDECVMAKINGDFSATDAAKAKWWTSQIQNDVIDACLQIFGGYGYMNEYRIARAWQDARVTKIWAGSNEIMKELIGRELGL
ncbi:MAG: alkylation response protein AidB-like acyl-CoA dehydrogenase [Actinomycetes bacterium]|jgi:alkylation response protein AidB-like acyl-CoA dehydrogenase